MNGRPSVYGDALTAIVMGHPETESYEDGYKDSETAYCRITRKGRTVYREFTVTMAKESRSLGWECLVEVSRAHVVMESQGQCHP